MSQFEEVDCEVCGTGGSDRSAEHPSKSNDPSKLSCSEVDEGENGVAQGKNYD